MRQNSPIVQRISLQEIPRPLTTIPDGIITAAALCTRIGLNYRAVLSHIKEQKPSYSRCGAFQVHRTFWLYLKRFIPYWKARFPIPEPLPGGDVLRAEGLYYLEEVLTRLGISPKTATRLPLKQPYRHGIYRAGGLWLVKMREFAPHWKTLREAFQ
jgi:hypothetical protein